MPKLKGIFDVLEDLGLAGSQDLSRVPNVPRSGVFNPQGLFDVML